MKTALKNRNIFAIALLSFAIISLSSCKKERLTIDPDFTIGKEYKIKSDVFNKGAYRPTNPVTVDSMYIDKISGLPFAKCHASIDWGSFAVKTGSGVAQMTVDANMIILDNLKKKNIDIGYLAPVEWFVPQADLIK
jgi:hypothetical protein